MKNHRPLLWRIIVWCLLGLTVLLFANASLLWGWLAAPAGTRFVGARTLIPADTPVYYSYIRQVMDGAVTLRDLYTAEAQPVGTFNLLWFLVGWFGRLLHVTPPVAFHLSRVLLGGALLWVLWRAAQWFLLDVRQRLVAWLLVFSGGIGIWLVPFLPAAEYLHQGAGYRVPIDLWLPWAFPILSLGQSPHLVASWALLVGTILLLAMAVEQHRWLPAVWAGVAAAALINFHPYHWPTLLLVPAVYLGLHWWRRRLSPVFARSNSVIPLKTPSSLFSGDRLKIATMILLVVAIGIALAYHRWLVGASPVVAVRSLQNISRLPPWPYVIAGLGLVAPLALIGCWRRQFTDRGLWLMAWVAAAAALAVWPSQFQARYLQGLLMPLAIFAAPPLVQGGAWAWQRFRHAGVLFFSALAAAALYATPLALVARDLAYYRQYPAAFYFPAEFFSATEWLRQHAAPNEVILASHDSGLFLPAYVGQPLYFGHGDETVGSAAKRSLVELFYHTSDSRTRRAILDRTGVRYVWYGRAERQFGGPPLDGVPGLAVAFENTQVTIYRFIPQGG